MAAILRDEIKILKEKIESKDKKVAKKIGEYGII